MKKFRKLTYMIFTIAMLFLGFLHIAPPVTASGILVTPMGQTITALPDTNFTLNFKMTFNQNDYGYFSVTFYWENNETAPEAEKWNFTYIGFVAKFTDGTPFSGPIKVSIGKHGSADYPGYYRYIVGIIESYGEYYGNETHPKEFWLNITMRNAGLKNGTYYPHAIGHQNITIVKVRCYELSQISSGPGVVTIRSENLLRPNANGDIVQWYEYPASGQNYDKVDETSSDEDSTYVYTTGSYAKDLYQLQDMTETSPLISKVRVYIRARCTIAGPPFRMAILIKTHNTEYRGPDITLSTSYTTYYYDWATNPYTGQAWTKAEVDALQAGMRTVYWTAGYFRVTMVWVEVT